MRRVRHLARRWATSLSRRSPSPEDVLWFERQLVGGELDLWRRMDVVDRRHSIEVARRFSELKKDSTRDEIAAALLHDVGKTASGLRTTERVLATVLGGRTERWRRYRDHETIGLEMCRLAGSSPATLALLSDPHHPSAEILRRADDL